MKNQIIIAVILIFSIFLAGCTSRPDLKPDTYTDAVQSRCEQLCNEKKSAGADLTAGPCLSDNNSDWKTKWNISDWVCDVAHNPRTAIDNNPANQCEDFRSGRAGHFVEVDTECNLIKKS